MPPKSARPKKRTAAQQRQEDALFEQSHKRSRHYNGHYSVHRQIDEESDTARIIPKSKPTPLPSTPLEAPAEEPLCDQASTTAEGNDASQTRTRQTINEFLGASDVLADELMDQYSNTLMGTPCSCGSQIRTVTCHECFSYEACCVDCFLSFHRHNPLHWAQLWDVERQFFVRRDFSALIPGHPASTIQLGHTPGEVCRTPSNPLSFQITHTNGTHATKIRYCECRGIANKRGQLMKARLFPATLKELGSAFTFAMLKTHHILSLQGKISAFDYIQSLRRLTDNTFTSLVNDPYLSFLRVQRVWEMFTLKKRLGQLHNIDTQFPHRPKGNLVLYCPCCPEADVNLQLGWNETPFELRHLVSISLTLDGNHKVPRYTKNSDASDKSLYNGAAYFPEQEKYEKYIAEAPKSGEKSTCNYLNAVNSQDRKKFRSMDETGMVNGQCDHVFVMSSVDMKYGEAFKYPDLALAMALSLRPFMTQFIPWRIFTKISYDIACEYLINIQSDNRYGRFFPELLVRVAAARWIIPALHIQNHKDDCMYVYSSSYMEAVAHFHGETSEYTWPNSNQIGPQVCQMNKGHRQDKLIDHHSDWNWKKMANQASLLANGLVRAWRLFIEKRSHFQQLTRLRLEHVPVWGLMNKEPRREGGEVKSPFRHSTVKAPTLEAIGQHLQQKTDEWLPSGVAVGQAIPFLTEALRIQHDQVRLRQDIKLNQSHPLASLQTSISTLTKQLALRIDRWRDSQHVYMPSVHKHVTEAAPCDTGDECLFLPSDFKAEERVQLNLVELAVHEAKLREGKAYDEIRSLQTAVKAVSAMRNRKAKNITGQAQLTRAGAKIKSAEHLQTLYESRYNETRGKLVDLGAIDDDDCNSSFPALKEGDLYRDPTEIKRGLGATYHRDGRLWTLGGVGSNTPSVLSVDPVTQKVVHAASQPRAFPSTFTVQSQRQAGYQKQAKKPGKDAQAKDARMTDATPTSSDSTEVRTSSPAEKRASGWIWTLKGGKKLTEEEMTAWELEEDRVQWFRAWAEMCRWLEEFELKHVEFMRCIKSFERLSSAWLLMSEDDDKLARSPGYRAYARRQSYIFQDLAVIAKQTFKEKGYSKFVDLADQDLIADKVLSFREAELGWLDDAIAGHELELDD